MKYILIIIVAFSNSLLAIEWEDFQKPFVVDPIIESITKATSVTLYLLDHEFNKGEDNFPVYPYDKETKILEEIEIPEDIIPHVKDTFISAIKSNDPLRSAFCHNPIHGIRFFGTKGEVLFETSICYECSNFYIPIGESYRWTGMSNDIIKELLTPILPIPKDEP